MTSQELGRPSPLRSRRSGAVAANCRSLAAGARGVLGHGIENRHCSNRTRRAKLKLSPTCGCGEIGRRAGFRFLPSLGSHGHVFEGYRLFPSPGSHGNSDSRPDRYRTATANRTVPHALVILPLMTKAQLKAEINRLRAEDPEARYYHRVICVRMLADGRTFASVAEMVHHSPSTLKRWWDKAKEGGFQALREAPRGRRKPAARSSAMRSPTGRR